MSRRRRQSRSRRCAANPLFTELRDTEQGRVKPERRRSWIPCQHLLPIHGGHSGCLSMRHGLFWIDSVRHRHEVSPGKVNSLGLPVVLGKADDPVPRR